MAKSFRDLINEIVTFEEVEERCTIEIKSTKGVHDLEFSVDITRDLFGSNIQLQEKKNTLCLCIKPYGTVLGFM
jgi:hypothetical protein